MKKTILYILIVSLVIISCKTKTEEFSETNQSVVQDYAQIFSKTETDSLSKKIIDFEQFSTNEICVYTIDSIPNDETALYHATKIAEDLSVGKKEKDNGLLILISKYDRQIAIATGYSTEKIITDYMCKTIIENTIVPQFKNGNYYEGINNALDSIMTKWK
ncbi:TPM domain-containing protein [Mariniflexile gromovii]|uniref:TPM domain-containing protein n=1 Tax=Mariniflexile gromovii TaxID=362523 RepID=A0ABS4BRK2_9FLAO|nr:TPM domain-containing protein [Mariniflexile gromovii]MBP0903213.1 TPM domain-containing protein [Mariniflexile gromovii]